MVRPQEGGIVIAGGIRIATATATAATATGMGIVHEGIPAGFHRCSGLGVCGLGMALLSLRGRPSPGTAAAAPPSGSGERPTSPAPRAATFGIVCRSTTTAAMISIVAVAAAPPPAGRTAPPRRRVVGRGRAASASAVAAAGHALLHGGQELRPAAPSRRADVRGRGGTERIQLRPQRVRVGGGIVVAGIGRTGQWRLLLLISSAGAAGTGRVHG